MKDELQFRDLVERYFQYWMSEYGFRIVHQEYNPRVFGNAIITLESPTHRIQLIRERGQVFMNIGIVSSKHCQYDLAMLVAYLNPDSTWSYESPDENSVVYSSTEWKLCEVQRVFLQYHKRILDKDFFTKNRQEIDKFIEQRYVRPYIER